MRMTKYVLMDVTQDRELESYGKFVGHVIVQSNKAMLAWVPLDDLLIPTDQLWWNVTFADTRRRQWVFSSKEEARAAIVKADLISILGTTFKPVKIYLSIEIENPEHGGD